MSAFSVLAPLYDRVNGDWYARYAALLKAIFDRHGKGSIREVLDIGCGTGGITECLADMGYDMIGLDNSADMLSMAQRRLAGKNVLLLQQDMRNFDLYGTVQAAFCSFDGLNYLKSAQDIEKTFRRVSLFLEPDGLFVFDVHTRERLESYVGNTFSYEFDDGLLLWRTEGRKDNAYRFSLDWFALREDGLYRRFNEEQTEYAHEADALRQIASGVGFETLSVFGADEEEIVPAKPCGNGNAKRYFVLRKERPSPWKDPMKN